MAARERHRRAANAVIAAVLALMVLSPLSYYTWREDRNDERFAWRMFSPTRMLRCDAAFTVGSSPQELPLYRTFHEAWVSLARRGRLAVTTAMAGKLCRDYPGQEVHLHLRCKGVDGRIETVVERERDQCEEHRR